MLCYVFFSLLLTAAYFSFIYAIAFRLEIFTFQSLLSVKNLFLLLSVAAVQSQCIPRWVLSLILMDLFIDIFELTMLTWNFHFRKDFINQEFFLLDHDSPLEKIRFRFGGMLNWFSIVHFNTVNLPITSRSFELRARFNKLLNTSQCPFQNNTQKRHWKQPHVFETNLSIYQAFMSRSINHNIRSVLDVKWQK